ncbi:TspO/MBR family protein [Pseudoroseicyclus tamaricis]|uniref:Tryptophan-rich sensory protein n=1 Tax=Pseudoroseicyclus tamaricis TaxID=2705421 RepID=A0A6B2JUH6_9RHOB|nr:TspO/MBR family protein [Pseudoroseicyclus tamaricis]NDV01968.1 tryptophan-rich sensory protein [Pseudoroseicyclus tamaricis]
MTHAALNRPHPWVSLALFLLLVVGAGTAIGFLTAPGAWYAELDKPGFTPPNWLFGPVWTALYICVAISGWRTWQRARSSRRMALWWGQLGLNWLWSPVFFTLHLLWPGMAVIAALWAVILAYIIVSWRSDRVAALLFVPYLAWVSYASALNLSIAVLN